MSEIKKSDDQSSAKFLYFTCKNCGKEKSHTEFYKNSNCVKTGGYSVSKCKVCKRSYSKQNKLKISEAKKENKNQMKNIKELQSIIQSVNDFNIYSDDEDFYEKFVILSESVLDRAKYLRDANKKDTISIKVKTNNDMDDLVEFQLRTSITTLISSYLNEHTDLNNIMPNDVYYKSIPPNIMIFTYHSDKYKYHVDHLETLKKDIANNTDNLIEDIM